MPRIPSHVASLGLIIAGAVAWAFAGKPLADNPDLKAPLNPLGINHSPYGEVFAMAMQTPIDAHFHEATYNGSHHHDDGETCEACEAESPALPQPSFSGGLKKLLVSFDKATRLRTNPKPASPTQKFYLRRQVEDKLRFAYQLDPSHYANYNSLHFFLTEPELGTRPHLTPSAAKLADDTIQYCLKQTHDPRPALTAAAAVCNILELMFNEKSNGRHVFQPDQMRRYLILLDYCLGRYNSLARDWDESNHWDLLSPQRVQECRERHHFITKVREAAEQTILHLEREAQNQPNLK